MKEQISALMDGELEVDGVEHLFTALKADSECTECWQTYHLIGDVMRGTQTLDPGLRHSIMKRLEAEPVVFAPAAIASWPLKVSRFPKVWSIAASIAAVAFVGWVVIQQRVGGEDVAPIEIAQSIPSEYLLAHQAVNPNSAAYYVQTAAYSQNGR